MLSTDLLWLLPVFIAYSQGIPLCVLAAIVINVSSSERRTPQGRILAAIVALLPVFSLVGLELAGASLRAHEQRSVWDDARAHWPYWAMASFAIVGGVLAFCRSKLATIRYKRAHPETPPQPTANRCHPYMAFNAWLRR